MFSQPQYTTPELQQYDYFVMQEPVLVEKIEEPVFTCVYEENGVLYCASSTSQEDYYYSYVLNNPLTFTDPSGYFTQIDFTTIVKYLLSTPYGGYWNDSNEMYSYTSSESAGNAGQSYMASTGYGGGSWYYGNSISMTIGGFGKKVNSFNKGKLGNWRIGGSNIQFEVNKNWFWVPDFEQSSLDTPLEPTPWLYDPIDLVYPDYSSLSQVDPTILNADFNKVALTVNPYYQSFEKAYNIANLGIAGTAIAMKSIRMNTNIQFRVGTLPDYWAKYSLLKKVSSGGAASYLGYGFVAVNTYYDYKAYQTGDIGAAELGFNTTTNLYGVYIGTAVGGPGGFVLGAMFDGVVYGSKYFFKNVVSPMYQEFYMRMYYMTHPTF